MEPMKHDPDYPPHKTNGAWVQPFVRWAEAPNGTQELDFHEAEVPPTLQQLLLNGLPGMHPTYGEPPKRKDPWDIDRISGLLASLILIGISLGFLAGGIALVRWAL